MNASDLPIYPNIKLPQKTIVAFDYTIGELKLFEYLKLYVYLKDELGQTVDTRVLTMEGKDYDEWIEDSYVVKWIKTQL